MDQQTHLTRPSFQLIIWDRSGDMVANYHGTKRTVSIAGRQPCDVYVPTLGAAASHFLMISEDGSELIREAGPGEPALVSSMRWGEPTEAGALQFLVLKSTPAQGGSGPELMRPRGTTSASDMVFRLVDPLFAWAETPMTSAEALHIGLERFLAIAIEGSRADNGMMVLAEPSGFRLIASHGLSRDEAHRVWDQMPDDLTLEIMRSRASMILPDALRDASSGKSTVFVKNIRSLVGFPIVAEDKLFGILYLGFKNIFSDLSPEVEKALERSASLAGLILQRALLREQLARHPEATMAIAGDGGEGSASERLMLGASPGIVQVYRMIERFAHVDIPVLITGETGTGKELAAKELHRLSPRAGRPFVIINAAALPHDIIESELFGHKKGSFTGALADRVGLIEQADRGTLFIDEIGELPLNVQAKFLRVLQERTVCRIGEGQVRKVDFRLVAATHRNLRQMVEEGTFREDLYYRIAGSVITLPPLRERGADILLLADHFKQRFCRAHNLPSKEWSWEAIQVLTTHDWSGNVRELEHVVTRSYMMAEGLVIGRRDLDLDDPAGMGSTSDMTANVVREENLCDARNAWMKAFIREALDRHEGNRARTAEALGIGQRTLFRYIEQYGIKESTA